jgi:hypothetical protein
VETVQRSVTAGSNSTDQQCWRALWFPKIRSGWIRAVRQNQRIIAFDWLRSSVPCNVCCQSIQVAAPARALSVAGRQLKSGLALDIGRARGLRRG